MMGTSRTAPRVLFVTEDLTLPIDEGLKKFVTSITSELRNRVKLEVIVTKPTGAVPDGVQVAPANLAMVGRELKRAVGNFDPTHVVYVPRSGGTRNAFIRGHMLSRYCPAAQMAMVMLQSRRYGRVSAAVVRRLRFPTIVTQGPSAKEELRRVGVEALDLPSGVDLQRFRPPSLSERASAKTALGLSTNDAMVLHVGHIKEDRNILLLERVRRELGCSVVLVGSTSTEQDESLRLRLESNQIMVISRYLEDIASIYWAADCYLFPVQVTGNAIEMPLSVLEALACGTPVVTTPFGSLPDWLDPGPAVTYGADDDSLIAATRQILQSDSLPVELVRQAAVPFSWSSVGDQLMALIGVDAVREASRMETQLVSA